MTVVIIDIQVGMGNKKKKHLDKHIRFRYLWDTSKPSSVPVLTYPVRLEV